MKWGDGNSSLSGAAAAPRDEQKKKAAYLTLQFTVAGFDQVAFLHLPPVYFSKFACHHGGKSN
jgi:hypothetical protein